ncbi:MAG: FtsX-like permease family protein [Opitutae bacterium]|nr:FtsX-like permease family protein [Opitutae bacterium]
MKTNLRTLFLLCNRGVRQFAFSSFVASLAIAMAGGLFLGTWKIKEGAQEAFNLSSGGFDAVLGARGSKLQLILNAVFHLEASPGNLKWEQYEVLKNTPGVKEAYPLAVGDNFMGYRLVGTLSSLFHDHEWKEGVKYKVQSGGRYFSDNAKEALVGNFVANKLNLKIGDTFNPYHGLTYREDSKHDEIYVVVGILEATGTPSDKVIWIPIKGIQLMEGHASEYATSVSAVLVKLKGAAGFTLEMKYNKQGNQATFAWPIAATLAQFFDRLVWFEKVLEWIAYLVGLVAGLIILAILRNSLNERKREFAILRCLGASRGFIINVVLGQSLIISMLGALGSLLIYFIMSGVASYFIRDQTGVLLDPFSIDFTFIYVFFVILFLGLISALPPAFLAYRVDISKNLRPLA